MEANSNALVKAAARAWYSRARSSVRATSGSIPPVSPIKMPAPPPLPSSPAITLLDMYEIEWITKQLEKLISSSNSVSGCDGSGDSRSPKRRKTGKKGFGFGKHAAAICGSVSEVVVEATKRNNRVKPPSKI